MGLQQTLCNLIIFHYIITKQITSITKKEIKYFSQFLNIILTPFVTLISVLVLSLLLLYKLFVGLILYMRHGRAFRGFITGCDALITLQEGDLGAMHIVLKIESNKSGEELFREGKEKISRKILSNKNINRKMFSTRRKSRLGYMYFLEADKIALEEVCKKISFDKKAITEREMLQSFEDLFLLPLPKHDAFNWDFTFCTTPLEKKLGDVKRTYFVSVRVHHVLGDGLFMHNIVANTLFRSDLHTDAYAGNLNQSMQKRNTRKRYPTHIKNDVGILEENTLRNIIFDGPTHKTSLYTTNQVSTQSYVQKIKQIKSKFKEVSFLNVVMTAYSASLAEYFAKHTPSHLKMPQHISVFSPIQMNPARFAKCFNNNFQNDFKNDFSCIAFNLPIIPNDKANTPIANYLTERMLLIKHELQDVMAAFDLQFTYIFLKTFGEVLPHSWFSKVISKSLFTSGVSCIPGGPLLIWSDDTVLKQVQVYSPTQRNYGLDLCILTYNGQFDISMVGDKEKFGTTEHLDEVKDGIIKYLDLLFEESQNY